MKDSAALEPLDLAKVEPRLRNIAAGFKAMQDDVPDLKQAAPDQKLIAALRFAAEALQLPK